MESNDGSLFKIASGWLNVWRFLVLTLGLVLIIVGGLSVIIKTSIQPLFSGAKIYFNSSGANIIEFAGKRNIQWLFPASKLWADSGLSVSKGDKVKIRISGQAHLAIHHLVDSSKTHQPPYFSWVGPDGYTEDDEKNLRGVDLFRQRYRLVKDEPAGEVLMQVVPEGKKPVNKFVKEQKDRLYYAIGSGREFTITESGRMFFAVNEVVLDESMKNIFVISNDAEYVKKHPIKDQKDAWSNIVKHKYWHAWFDDNIGFFLVSAEISN